MDMRVLSEVHEESVYLGSASGMVFSPWLYFSLG